MKSKKSSKSTKQDKTWQEKIEKQVKVEKVKLDHPKGKERFEGVIRQVVRKNTRENKSSSKL